MHRRNAVVGRRGVRPVASKDNINGDAAKSGTTSPMPRGGLMSMPTNEELLDYASSSESETKELKGEERACHHCFSSCRFFFKWFKKKFFNLKILML